MTVQNAATAPQHSPNFALDLDHYRDSHGSWRPAEAGLRLLTEEDEMQFHGIDFEHAWRIAFWVILVLAGVASAAHAIFA